MRPEIKDDRQLRALTGGQQKSGELWKMLLVQH
jgi:hypothetical protein